MSRWISSGALHFSDTFPLGMHDGLLYSIRVAVVGDDVAQVYMHWRERHVYCCRGRPLRAQQTALIPVIVLLFAFPDLLRLDATLSPPPRDSISNATRTPSLGI